MCFINHIYLIYKSSISLLYNLPTNCESQCEDFIHVSDAGADYPSRNQFDTFCNVVERSFYSGQLFYI